MSKKKYPVLENIEITDFAAEGKSLARVDNYVVFVPFTVPGDVVDLQVIRKKHSFMEAKVVRFHRYSADRVQPFCLHFGICGGCKWQMLSYEKQLEYKQKQVADTLLRIGKVSVGEMLPIIGDSDTREYRNKIEFSCSNKRWLTEEEVQQQVQYDNKNAIGFHIPGAFDKVLDIKECHLMTDLQNRVRNGLRDFANTRQISFFDLRNQVGVLRYMLFRTSNSG